MLRIDIITIFPDFFREVVDYGIVRRARKAGLVEVIAHDLRQWTTDKHHIVDDRPFGGGDGMVLKPEPIFAGVEALTGAGRREDLPAKYERDFAFTAGSSLFPSRRSGDGPSRQRRSFCCADDTKALMSVSWKH